jgi:organic hydroperoxide reductase OsmC/OhrA
MMGTFAAMLAKDRIPTPADRYQARVSGEIEAVEGVLKIVRSIVDYTLKIADDKRAAAERAFDGYITHCPAATSVMGCIDIKHTLTLKSMSNELAVEGP